VTRNWFDAIVSGYLYHKAGYECWIEYRGSENPIHHSKHFDMEQHYHNKYWDDEQQYLTWHSSRGIPYPPRHNRSLCTYLQQESEQDGIRIIIDLALSRWYKGIVAYHEKATQNNKYEQRSLFLCYEDLVDPFHQEQVFYRILDFMFPGANTNATSAMPAKMKHSLQQQQQDNTLYAGGHASAHDPQVRTRLRAMVDQYDRELFNDTIATSNTIFGCGR